MLAILIGAACFGAIVGLILVLCMVPAIHRRNVEKVRLEKAMLREFERRGESDSIKL